jgi:hypothetical protein
MLLVGASIVVVLSTASIAGATTTSSPKKWVSTLCTTFVGWEQAAKTNDLKLDSAIATLEKSGHANLTKLRAQLAGFLGKLAVASHKAQSQMKVVGAPSVPHGSDIQKTVVNALGTAAAFLDHSKAKVLKFPTGKHDTAAFVNKTQALTASITTTFNKVASSLSALNKYHATQLKAAASSDPACKKLAG